MDFAAPGPALAIASGTIIKISPRGSFAGGTGEAVYISMDQPYTAPSGRTYYQIYYAEQRPLVHMPGRVRVGDPVMAPGGSEIGFASNGVPACNLVGGLGAGSQPTVCGRDMYTFLGLILGLGAPPLPPPPPSPGVPPTPTTTRAYPTHAHKAFHDLQAEIVVGLPKALRQTRRIRAAMVRRAR